MQKITLTLTPQEARALLLLTISGQGVLMDEAATRGWIGDGHTVNAALRAQEKLKQAIANNKGADHRIAVD